MIGSSSGDQHLSPSLDPSRGSTRPAMGVIRIFLLDRKFANCDERQLCCSIPGSALTGYQRSTKRLTETCFLPSCHTNLAHFEKEKSRKIPAERKRRSFNGKFLSEIHSQNPFCGTRCPWHCAQISTTE